MVMGQDPIVNWFALKTFDSIQFALRGLALIKPVFRYLNQSFTVLKAA